MRTLVANWLWLLVFSAFALGFIVGGASALNEAPTQQHAERPNIANNGTEGKPPTISQAHAEQETPKAEAHEKQSAWSWISSFFELKLTDVIIAIFTVVLAVKTSGLFVETAGLRSAADKQSLDMQESIAVAKRSADAAQKAAEIAEKSLSNTERAFVFMKYMYASPIYAPNKLVVGWDFHVVWENSGSSPTQFMVARKNWVFFEGAIPEHFDFPDFGDPTHQSQPYMGPKAVVDAGALQVGNDVLEKVAKGPARLLMYGWAEYNDVFGPNIRHRSEFCSEIGIDGSLLIPPDDKIKPPFVFQVYKKHNGTGAECYRKPITTGFS
jgi:hypothetical protein